MKYKYCLVIESDPDLAEETASHVKKCGLLPIIAKDGTAAIVKIDRQSFDLIILDLGIPKMSGVELLKNLLSSSRVNALKYKLPPIILTTNNLIEHMRVLRPYLGDYPLIEKPYTFDKLKPLILDRYRPAEHTFKEHKVDLSLLYNLGIHSLIHGLKNLGGGISRIISEDIKNSPLTISNPMIGRCSLFIQGQFYDCIFSIPFDWCNQTSKILAQYVDDAEDYQDKKIEVISYFFEDIMKEHRDLIERKTLDIEMRNIIFYYNTLDIVYHNIPEDKTIIQAQFETPYGFLNYIVCGPQDKKEEENGI